MTTKLVSSGFKHWDGESKSYPCSVLHLPGSPPPIAQKVSLASERKGLNSKSPYSSCSLSNSANDLKRDQIRVNESWMRQQTTPDKHNAKWTVRTQKFRPLLFDNHCCCFYSYHHVLMMMLFGLWEFNFMTNYIQCPTSIFKDLFGFSRLRSSYTRWKRRSPRVHPPAVWLEQMESNPPPRIEKW